MSNELERILAGHYDGTALAQFLDEHLGDTGYTVGILANAFAMVAGVIVLANFAFGNFIPELFVAGLTVLSGLYAGVETGVDALTDDDIGSVTGSWHFSVVVITLTIFTGFILRGLWVTLSPTAEGRALFFATAALLFGLWARTDF